MSIDQDRRRRVSAFLAMHCDERERVAKKVRDLMQQLDLPPVEHGTLTGKLIQMGLKRRVPKQYPPLAFIGDAIWLAACTECVIALCEELELAWSAQRTRGATCRLADRAVQGHVTRAINLMSCCSLNATEAAMLHDVNYAYESEKIQADFLEVLLGAIAMGESVSAAIKLAKHLIDTHLANQLLDAVASAWDNSRNKLRKPMSAHTLIGAHRVQCHYGLWLVLQCFNTRGKYIWAMLQRNSDDDRMLSFLERAARDDEFAQRVASVIAQVHGYPLAALAVHLAARATDWNQVTHSGRQTVVQIGAETYVLRVGTQAHAVVAALRKHA